MMGLPNEIRITLSFLLGLILCSSVLGAGRGDFDKLELEAKRFFESFSKALEKHDAAMHVAPQHRKRFSKGYKFWRGSKLSALKVVGLPDKDGVLRVRTQIGSPTGKKDTETKKLLRVKDKWFLLEK